jgi:hypothetical protein
MSFTVGSKVKTTDAYTHLDFPPGTEGTVVAIEDPTAMGEDVPYPYRVSFPPTQASSERFGRFAENELEAAQ